jgi:hypothetical protein
MSPNRPIHLVVVLSLLVGLAPIAHAFNTYQVGTPVKGREYNDVLKQWFDRTLTIWVGVDAAKTEYLIFTADTGIGQATVLIRGVGNSRKRLRALTSKALEWSDVARKNRTDISKPLGCLGEDEYSLCARNGTAFSENQLGLMFYAAESGAQTDLILSVVDRDNRFKKVTVYLDSAAMRMLLRSLDEVDTALKKARNTQSKQDLFK